MKTRLLCFSATLVAVAIAQTGWAQSEHDLVRHYVDAQGREVTMTTGQPAPDQYGPRPTFESLDRNHDGSISREEAEAYPPLDNDFDYLAHGANRITAAQYARWSRK